MNTWNKWNKAYDQRPLNPLCGKTITIHIVGKRCVYINDHRVQGEKPYHSENLPYDTREVTIREVLDAFNIETLQAYISEKIAIDAYCAGLRNYRDAAEEGGA